MKTYALKRAKVVLAMKDSLHPEFIVEFADTALFPPGFHKPEDGFEFMPEDLFVEELAKNESLHAEFLAHKAKLDQELLAVQAQKAALDAVRERKEKQEYEDFLKWKKMKGK